MGCQGNKVDRTLRTGRIGQVKLEKKKRGLVVKRLLDKGKKKWIKKIKTKPYPFIIQNGKLNLEKRSGGIDCFKNMKAKEKVDICVDIGKLKFSQVVETFSKEELVLVTINVEERFRGHEVGEFDQNGVAKVYSSGNSISKEEMVWDTIKVENNMFGLARFLSDYNAILIGEKCVDWGPKMFCFFNGWLEDKELMKEAMKGWKRCKVEGSNGWSISAKTKRAKISMRAWLSDNKKDHFKNVKWRRPKIRGPNFRLLSVIESEALEVDFNEENVWATVCNCDGNNSPRPDSLNLNFVKANWGVIKKDFIKFILEFHKNGYIVKDLNKTFLALILKCAHPDPLKEFRPISLVSSMYKILAKVLPNCLKMVMDSVVGLLAKWVWRYGQEDKPLWKRAISSKYGVKVDSLIWKWEARVPASHFVKVVNGLFVKGFISVKILDRGFCVVVGCIEKSAPLEDVSKISTRAVFQSSASYGGKSGILLSEDQLLKIRKSKKLISYSNEALKFNVDGSVLVELGRVRIRGVLHDSKGVVLCSFSASVGNVGASRLS
ncbi:hypothetical protein Ddye_002095 [Dipteronia dyeriana]|uniref:Uncharacterized protein n=1 Tax=Dipteronia dyeriana TaxID=168575 RepID=A0AAE0CU46_9ROSI|nr:hypothetical protein Ddye_002095 [Dipteronia dyeriana]